VQLYLRDDLGEAWVDPFAEVQALRGDVYRSKEGRTTLRFVRSGNGYFLKLHRGVGWGEIAKNLLQLRAPVLGAQNEWCAIEHLHRLNVDTMTLVACGKRGWNPARQLSFLVTEELTDMVSLEDFCEPWLAHPPTLAVKRRLIEQVAQVARVVHGSGMNHRDFYLCHFLMPLGWDGLAPPRLYLIDLHRAQIRAKTPRRWLVKDLASLYFSALDIGLSQRDILRFLRCYTGMPLKQVLRDRAFWSRVCARTRQLYRRDFNRQPVLPLS
jgi:heptose I phosphotransferase